MTTTTTPDNTGQDVTDATSDDTGKHDESQETTNETIVDSEEEGGEEVDLDEVGKNFQQSKRVKKLAQKEVNRYNELVDEDGNIDYDAMSTIYRGNKVSENALEIFCQDKGLDIDDVKEQLQSPYDKIKKLEERLARIETVSNAEASFSDILKAELDARGVSTKEFSRYKDEFENELEELTGLEDNKAIKKALDYTLGAGTKSKVKVVPSDAGNKGTKESPTTMTKDDYFKFLTKRSKEVGDAKAVEELEAYEKSQKAKGLPFYK